MRGLILFIGLLLLFCGWAATTGSATADDCKDGQCPRVSIPDAVATSTEQKVEVQECPGGVCSVPQSAPVAQKYEQPRGVMSRVRNRVRQWRPFGGLSQRRRG